jgi:hypothetical protein
MWYTVLGNFLFATSGVFQGGVQWIHLQCLPPQNIVISVMNHFMMKLQKGFILRSILLEQDL